MIIETVYVDSELSEDEIIAEKQNADTNLEPGTEYSDYIPHFDNFDYMGAYKKVRELGRPLTEEELKEFEAE